MANERVEVTLELVKMLRSIEEIATREAETKHLEERENFIKSYLAAALGSNAIVCRLDELREQQNLIVIAALQITIVAQKAEICESLKLVGRCHFIRGLGCLAEAMVEW